MCTVTLSLGNAERRRDQLAPGAGVLRRRPELDLAVLEMRGAVLRLQADMRRGTDRRRRLRRHARRPEGGCRRRRRAQQIAAGVPLREFRGLAAKPRAALRSGRAFVPGDLQRRRARCSPAHQFSATMATPSRALSPCGLASPPRTTKASRTPGSALIASMLALTTLPPNTGHFWNTA